MKINTSKIEKIMKKLKHKNPVLFIALQKKISQIALLDKKTIEHLKNLKKPMQHLKRVRIQSFVLTFKLEKDTIFFEDFDHHDKIYKKNFPAS